MRARKWCRYLPEFGWEPVVFSGPFHGQGRCPPVEGITVFGREREAERSPTLCHRAEPQHPERAGAGRESLKAWLKGFLVPDSYVLRWLPAVWQVDPAAFRTLDAIVSTSPLDTCHLVGLALKRRLGLPWVADFRDPWVANPFALPRPLLAETLNRRLERRVVAQADLITCVSRVHLEAMQARYPDHAAKMIYLPNGYDPADLADVPAKRLEGRGFTLVHAGTFYGPRRPDVLLQALRELPPDVRLVLVGGESQDVREAIARYGAGDRVRVTPMLPHDEALAWELGADLLVLIPGADYAVPGKLYEYAASGRPILHLGARSSASGRLLDELGIGCHATTASEVVTAVQALRSGQWAPVRAELQRYERRHLAGELASCLDELARA